MGDDLKENDQPKMELEPQAFVKKLLESKKTTRKKLLDDKANLEQNSFNYNLFAPPNLGKVRRYLGQSDNLINPSSFAGYWHQRNKKRPAGQEEYIYVKANDIDGDTLEDNVAGKKIILLILG